MTYDICLVYHDDYGNNIPVEIKPADLDIQSLKELNSIFLLENSSFMYDKMPEKISFDLEINDKINSVFKKYFDDNGITWLDKQDVSDTIVPLTYFQQDIEKGEKSNANIEKTIHIIKQLINLATIAKNSLNRPLFWEIEEE